MALATDYRRLLNRARLIQLRMTARQMERLVATYTSGMYSVIRAARDLAENPPRDMDESELVIEVRRRLASARDIAEAIRDTVGDQHEMLTRAMLEQAQAAADTQAEIEQMLSRAVDPQLIPDSEIEEPGREPIRFSRLARDVVDAQARRYYSDGLNLSDRFGALSTDIRREIEDTVVRSLMLSESAPELAARLEGALVGTRGPAARARTIARTEIMQAHRAATNAAAMDQTTGQPRDYIIGIGWALSSAHRDPDICDVYATHDSGLGPGIYHPTEVPRSHPNCLCSTFQVLRDAPTVFPVRTEPRPTAAPVNELQRYAGAGDAAAAAALAAREATGGGP